MKIRSLVKVTTRRSLAFLIGVAMVIGGAPGVFAEATTSAIAGVIIDPSGHPAEGFKVTVKDVASNTEYTSGPTDAAGNYSVQVPLGGRYKIEGVLAADGVTKLPVQDIPPVSVLTAGTTRMNVRFSNPAPAGAAAPAAVAAATPAGTQTGTEESNKKDKGAVPWYKKPGPIVGMVLGGAAIVALALSGGSDNNDNNASPSAP